MMGAIADNATPRDVAGRLEGSVSVSLRKGCTSEVLGKRARPFYSSHKAERSAVAEL